MKRTAIVLAGGLLATVASIEAIAQCTTSGSTSSTSTTGSGSGTSGTTSTTGGTTTVGGTCPYGSNGFADGCANAPAGAVPYPNVFSAAVKPHPSAYPTRPEWDVPGVDYSVGVPSNVTLADFQATGVLPSSCTWLNKSTGLVEVTSTPCQLSAIDFSQHGGACVYITSGAGSGAVTITNSKFSVGTATACTGAYLVSAAKGFAGNLDIENNTFLGNGPTTQGMSAAIGSSGSGPVTIKYNYITKLDQHGVDFAAAPTSITERYNVITDFGMQSGSHPNFTYFCGGTFQNVDIEFNLSAEWYGDGAQAAAQGMTIHADSGCGSSLISPVVAHNVVLNPGTGAGTEQTASYVLAPTQDSGATLSGVNMSNNFVDWTGGYGPMYPSKGTGFICSGNVDVYRGSTIAGTFGSVICD